MKRRYACGNHPGSARRGNWLLSSMAAAFLVLGTFLVLGVGAGTALQEGDYTYSVQGNPLVATVTGYTGPGGDIIIPSTLGGYPVVHIGIDAFDYITTITSVTIPDSVVSIDDQAFQFCSSLSSVSIGSAVTTIKIAAFNKCTSLAHVSLPDSVTIIGDSSFANCDSLVSVDFGTGISSIGMSAFNADPILTSISFYGLTAPTYVGAYWIQGTDAGILGHAYAASSFPLPGGKFYGLTMGDVIPSAPLAPTGLAATAGSAQVTLVWDAPASDGGSAITGYKVYRGVSSGSEALLASPGNVLSYTDMGLSNGQTYYYQVSAENSLGESPPSNEASATPAPSPTVPSAPILTSATPGDGQATLIWEAPTSNGGSTIDGYRVHRGTVSGGESFLTSVGLVLTYLDLDLTNGVTYYYKVSASNSAGEGPQSNEMSAKPVGKPGSPMNLAASPSDSIVNLTWQAPSGDGGSAILNYQVWRSTTSGAEAFLADIGVKLWFDDAGLTNGVTYFYQVKAENAQGLGPASNEVSATPDLVASAPSAPLNLTATAGDARSTLTWSAPSSDGGSPIVGFKLYRGTSPGGEVLLATLGNVLSYTDAGQTNGQAYYYRLTAVNAAGEGPMTSEVISTPNAPYSDGGNDTLLYVVIGAAAVLVLIVAALVVRRR
jgi:fibronectin type 3 domain-containing protein